MANERRVRDNFITGVTTTDPLAAIDTTMDSDELVALQEIDATEHAVLVLDPLGEGNGPEIVYVTAHTAGATTADIVRGRNGTSAVEHAVGTKWKLSPVRDDFILVVASSASLPDEPYVGQLVYVIDAYELLQWNGLAWYPPWNLPWGILSHSKSTSSGALAGLVTGETVVMTTGSASVPNGRRVAVHMKVEVSTNIDGSPILWKLRRGTSTGGTLVEGGTHVVAEGSRSETLEITAIDTPPANAALQYVLTLACFDPCAAGGPWEKQIEDRGPAANPS